MAPGFRGFCRRFLVGLLYGFQCGMPLKCLIKDLGVFGSGAQGLGVRHRFVGFGFSGKGVGCKV